MNKRFCIMTILLLITLNKAHADGSKQFVYKGAATFVIKADRIQDFKAAVSKIIAPTRKERGNIEYEALQVLDSSGKPTNKFEFHELWKSKAAMMIDHKENSAHMAEFFKAMAIGKPESMVESFEVHGSNVQIL